MKFFDISWTIKSGMQVYPGNPQVEVTRVQDVSGSKNMLSRFVMGSHTGTHCDAPRHVRKRGVTVDKLVLDHFYGPCRVIDVSRIAFGAAIEPRHISRFRWKAGAIVLFKTRNSGLSRWREDYVFLSEEAARMLAAAGVKTVCVDYLSVQKFHQGYCAAHCALLDEGCVIVEGVRLKGVPAGQYTFCGAPLKVAGAEAAPMRAFLVR